MTVREKAARSVEAGGRVLVSLEGPAAVALLAVAVVALTSWPWAVLLVGLALLLDVALRSFRPVPRAPRAAVSGRVRRDAGGVR